jgi:hypothetical protein
MRRISHSCYSAVGKFNLLSVSNTIQQGEFDARLFRDPVYNENKRYKLLRVCSRKKDDLFLYALLQPSVRADTGDVSEGKTSVCTFVGQAFQTGVPDHE